jgi:hypothetical protein
MRVTDVEPTPENPEGYAPDLLAPDAFPALATLSAGPLFGAVVRPNRGPVAPQYVFVPTKLGGPGYFNKDVAALTEWNLLWECGHIRPDFLEGTLPQSLDWTERHGGVSFRFVPFDEGPRASGKLQAYGALRSLLPLPLLRRFCLAPLRASWPPFFHPHGTPQPRDAVTSLSRAFAEYIWPLLCPGSGLQAFAEQDSVRLLAHNLDYWLPHLDLLIQRRVEAGGRARYESEEQRREFEQETARVALKHDAAVLRPCRGISAWSGEDEAWEAAQEMVDIADANGRLRGILDAIRSHRVEDDFSPRWSRAKEDLERKLHAKRRKVRVTFVELTDTVPVFAPDAEADFVENRLWQDLFAVVNRKDRRVVVCLRSGWSSATEIARELGYANHSPISKAVSRIREKAARLLQ